MLCSCLRRRSRPPLRLHTARHSRRCSPRPGQSPSVMLSSAPKAQAYFGNVEDLMDGLRLRQHPMMNKPGLIAMRCGAVRCGACMCVCVSNSVPKSLIASCRGAPNPTMWHSCPTTCNEAVDMSGKRELITLVYLHRVAHGSCMWQLGDSFGNF